MKKTMLASCLFLLVVTGVVIAIALYANRRVDHDDRKSAAEANATSPFKAVNKVCAPTQYKGLCVETLNGVGNSTSDPIELIKAVFKAAIECVKESAPLVEEGSRQAKDLRDERAISDCKELLQFAEDELQASYSMVGDKDMHTLNDRVAEMRNWLSAVISYEETCSDGITHPDLKSFMQNGLVNASQLTSNALAIVSEISSVLSAFDIPFNLSSLTSSRRLLATGGASADQLGFPSWVPESDQRLLLETNVKPDAVVAQDGSGDYKTISEALNAMPKESKGRYKIYVKAGRYKETVMVDKKMVNVYMYGDGPTKTIVSGSKNFIDGYPTFQTATFAALGEGFIAKSMGFENVAGPQKHQAVALRVQSDRSVFYECRIDGYQDSLYVQTHYQFYRNCIISGTVDFIFGDATVVIQNCLIIARRPMDNQFVAVTAQGRKDKNEPTGIVIQNCRIVAEKPLIPVRFKIPIYLGRPWKLFARTVIMESELGDFIKPSGWKEWEPNVGLDTLFYAEYENRGPGAKIESRVKWPGFKVLNKSEALQYSVGVFLRGETWIKYSGVPVIMGLKST